MNKKKTKIVATIGPASENKETLKKMVEEGLNVMRLNFSHGDFDEHQKRVNNFREIAKELGVNLGILQDLSGPKIRIGDFETEQITLEVGQKFTLTTEEIIGTKEKAYINYPHLSEDLKEGNHVLLDDGKLRLEVKKIEGKDIITEVLIGGEIRGRRGVNLPGIDIQLNALTDKDKKDLEFGAKNKVDFVALSFVRKASDIKELKELIKVHNFNAKVISKIETQQAVDNIEEIIKESDGIMVARGDLAIEIGPERVPEVQKMIIRYCNRNGKPVITATQMLESMIENAVPTRAEVSDIANAILDGTDAIMLSGETTIGKYPVEVVRVMSRVALKIEEDLSIKFNGKNSLYNSKQVVNSVTTSAIYTADEINAKALIALSNTGFTARMMSRFKSKLPVIALSPNQKTCNTLSLSFGCQSIKIEKLESITDALDVVRRVCLERKIAKEGDLVLVVAG
ncbi:MAG: pyruvate kinase, partial [Candidatus Paceibacterota bacterium]